MGSDRGNVHEGVGMEGLQDLKYSTPSSVEILT